MNTQVERVIKEYERYADFCTRFQNNLASGSTIVSNIREMNQVLVMQNHLRGFGKLLLVKFSHQVVSRSLFSSYIKFGALPFIELKDSDKPREYRVLERQLDTNQRSLNQIESQYEAFYANSIISDYIAPVEMIVAPTIANNGNFRYPILSSCLKHIVKSLNNSSAQTLEEAVLMLTKENSAFGNSKAFGKTAETANYSSNNRVSLFFS
ncbi:hypothetical protein [Companilactobacillus mishanensis]|uniref:hypothetical protein n=1 Tax=Companilactobacillus mishanensis TaxID=2486008 RepID=UPI001294CCAB|nr:hypothetical protein [Companilactobacillus mishanensis]MQS89827.1 hypothetical protein [Companilactobacillus mishanensis]